MTPHDTSDCMFGPGRDVIGQSSLGVRSDFVSATRACKVDPASTRPQPRFKQR
jgi:hypothetical protein